jgi:hypothetical protein
MAPALPPRTSGHPAAVSFTPRASRPCRRRRAGGQAPLLRPARDGPSGRGGGRGGGAPRLPGGGRPASVRARRTAAPSPRTTAAAGARRPARRRARGRPPRPRFCRACLAWRAAASRGCAASRRSGKGPRGWGPSGPPSATAPRRDSGPSDTRPPRGTGPVGRTVRSSAARSGGVADTPRRARRPAPERPARRPQSPSGPPAGWRPARARRPRPWAGGMRCRRAVAVRERVSSAS